MSIEKKGLFELHSPFSPTGDQPLAIDQLVEGFKTGKKHQTLLGVTGSGKTFSMANVIAQLGKKTLILAHNKTLAAQLYGEFREFFPNNAVEYFVSYYDYYRPEAYLPSTDTFIEKDSSINDEIDKLRHSATRSLLERDDVIIIASVSCIYGIGSPDEYEAHKIPLFIDEKRNREEFLRELVSIQYARNDIDFSRGNFRVRGDIVDIYPSHEDSHGIRVEFFDDGIEGLYLIDPLRGTVIQSLNRVVIYPSSHYVVGEQNMKRAVKDIQNELREQLQYFEQNQMLLEKQRIEQRTLYDLEMMEEMGFCSGIENYSRHLINGKAGDPPPTLIDYFKKDFLLIVDESHITIPQVGGMYRGDRSRKETLVGHGFRLPSALDNRPLNFDEFEQKVDTCLYVSATPAKYELKKSGGEYVEQIIRPTGLLDPPIELRDATHQVDDVLVESKKTIKQGFRVLITTLTKKLAEELTTHFEGVGLKVRYLHSDIDTIERMEIIRDLRRGVFDILVGINLLREGLDIPEVALVGILDADKEGFLRSTRSLIQTIGRAARNSEGRVILYAYRKTKSIHESIKETERRRSIQHQYNLDHGITPKTITKKISGGVIETLAKSKRSQKGQSIKQSESVELTAQNIDERIEDLSEEMKLCARELRFEEAAKLRDEIKELKQARLLL